ncbi:MAG: class I SAM-dependent methyltransferase [Deferrisomatales bacterium]|nr:class I SAM-dependent methyltransferase [Deferrisomatales bacterium]
MSAIIPFRRPPEAVSPYDAFAWFYDRHWAHIFAAGALAAVDTLLLPHIPICGRVLDLCCGTGQLAAELAGRGYRTTGVDFSGEMLACARQHHPSPDWVRADVRQLALAPAFDAATCLFDSINHLLTAADLQRALTCAGAALAPGGLLLFDVNTELGFRERWVREWEVATPDGVCRLAGEYDPARRLGTYHFVLRGQGVDAWRRAEFEFHERCHSPEELRRALDRADLEIEEVCDAVSDLDLEEEVGRAFYLVRRP